MVKDREGDVPSSTDASQPSRQQQRMARPKRREKISAEDMEERFEGWAMARREKSAERTPEQDARRLRISLVAGMLVITVALLAFFGFQGNSYETARAQGSAWISELEDDLAVAQAPRDDEARVEALTELSKQVSTKAGKVADAQQGFAALERAAVTSPAPGNGAPSDQMKAVAEHRRTLAPYFEENSFVVEDEEAYQWSTGVTHEADEIDPRYAWYIRHDNDVPSKTGASTWRVEAAMPTAGGKGTAHVVWTCIDTATGEVLAYASADYSDETGMFSDLTVGVTALGTQHDGNGKAYGNGDGS